jgi:catechol 2,3-dioxygenase-like lactoylglutathione lyase family enzyme
MRDTERRAAATMNLFQVNLMVENFPEMLGFYRDQLGFAVIDIDPGPPAMPLVNWASLQTGSAILELFDVATYGDPNKLRDSARDVVQLCFIVDDVDTERARLVARGVSCDEVIEEEWGRFAGFRDPERNSLQIFEVFDTSDHR